MFSSIFLRNILSYFPFIRLYFSFISRKQNIDYIDYLIKALYFECRKNEDWEQKADSDLDKFSWESARIKAKDLVKQNWFYLFASEKFIVLLFVTNTFKLSLDQLSYCIFK